MAEMKLSVHGLSRRLRYALALVLFPYQSPLSLSLAFSFFLSSSSSFSASPVHSFFHIRRGAYSTSRKRHLTVKSCKEL